MAALCRSLPRQHHHRCRKCRRSCASLEWNQRSVLKDFSARFCRRKSTDRLALRHSMNRSACANCSTDTVCIRPVSEHAPGQPRPADVPTHNYLCCSSSQTFTTIFNRWYGISPRRSSKIGLSLSGPSRPIESSILVCTAAETHEPMSVRR